MTDSNYATCRICHGDEEPLYSPCNCTGSISFVHFDCLKQWQQAGGHPHCEVCGMMYRYPESYSQNESYLYMLIVRTTSIVAMVLDTVASV